MRYPTTARTNLPQMRTCPTRSETPVIDGGLGNRAVGAQAPVPQIAVRWKFAKERDGVGPRWPW